MSIELRLYPVVRDMDGVAHTAEGIAVTRYAALLHAIRQAAGCPVRSMVVQGRRTVHADGYGAPLRSVAAGALIDAAAGMVLTGENAATWAYLATLPPMTRIVLYWH